MQTFYNYWSKIYFEELYDFKGWKPVYTNNLPPRHTLLREERIPYVGDYAEVDEHNNIIARIAAERFVLMMMPYLQLNRKGLYDVLAFDIDSNFDLQLLIDAGIPLPRYFVSRLRQEGDADTLVRRPHLVYWLRRPVKRGQTGRATRPEAFFLSIKKKFETSLRALGLDVDPKPLDLSKNPHSDLWDVNQGEYRDWSLEELATALPRLSEGETSKCKVSSTPQKNKCAFARSQPTTEANRSVLSGCAGRNEFIFKETRLFAYPLKNLCADEGELYARVESFAHTLNRNHFSSYAEGSLGDTEVDTIVRSVVNFVINKYSGRIDDKDRGVCAREGLIEAGMPLRQKQGIGGRFGAQKNADKTRSKIQDALRRLKDSISSPSVSDVARHADVSRTTARKWMKILATESAAINQTQVVNTVPIRKRDRIVSVWAWERAGNTRKIKVTALAGTRVSGMLMSSINEHLSKSANNQINPPPSLTPEDIAKYRHPYCQELALTIRGSVVPAPKIEEGKGCLPWAPTRVLDLGGFLDDDIDEHAPPVGEIDHFGRVRYPEEIYAPTRIGIKTKVWSDEDVDHYFEMISAVGAS
ncbi:hypothetical protein ACFE33_15840 (plasmid) [Falsihalocynthiibacter sp. SS001]|uniref:hypothetical protein n=1 Tax=Falsihalocynthiibacter sp. SS001 TaxID=3349698 RepID=UPI0036D2B617